MSEELSPDFLKRKYEVKEEYEKHKRSNKIILKMIVVFLLITVPVIAFGSFYITNTYVSPPEEGDDSTNFSLFSSIKRLVTSEEKELAGEEDNRVNFLLLGVGGAGHDGPELSDTIIFSSYQPDTNEVGLLSIPRDLTVDMGEYGYRKINAANAYGEMEEKGTGPQKSMDIIGDILDQEIHYYIKVDFAGFEDLIDAIGGIDVYVDNSFSDYQYPAPNYLYQTITFTEGWTTMDGDEALKYARSRHGTNGEGSDFARAKRQQNVIMAVKEKVLSPSTLLNPGKLSSMISVFTDNVDTNISVWEMTKLAKVASEIDTDNLTHHVLDTNPEGPLYETKMDGAYVILPKKDNWSDLQMIAENIFSRDNITNIASAQPAIKSHVSVEIQNSTSIVGLAFETSQMLASSGFDVVQIGNARGSVGQTTLIYDLTDGKKDDELTILKSFLEADIATEANSSWIYTDDLEPTDLETTILGSEYVTSTDPVDFLIILGEDASDFVLR